MAEPRKVNTNIALAIAIISGVVIGKLIKKFAFGLLIGVFISLLYVLIASRPRAKK